MANLLSQKITELETKKQELERLIATAKQELAESSQATTQAQIQKATQSLESKAQELAGEIHASNTSKLQEAKDSLSQEITRTLTQAKSDLSQTFAQRLETQLENNAEQFQRTALENLKEHLARPTAEAVLHAPKTRELVRNTARQEAREAFNDLDLQSLLDYSRLDSQDIAENLATRADFQAQARQELAREIRAKIANLDTESEVTRALRESASEIYQEAMKSDELIKDRLESKMRLLCLKIYGTQELVEKILIKSSKLYQEANRPATPTNTVNNILVAK